MSCALLCSIVLCARSGAFWVCMARLEGLRWITTGYDGDTTRTPRYATSVGGEDVVRPLVALGPTASIGPTGGEAPRGTSLQALFPPCPLREDFMMRIGIHNKSAINERTCLVNRVLMKTPTVDQRQMALLVKHSAEVWSYFRERMGLRGGEYLPQWSKAKVTRHMVQRHGSIYSDAAKSLVDDPLSKKDSRVKMFLKAEKSYVEAGAELKDPRAIQYRGPRFNLMLGKFVIPLEQGLYPSLSSYDLGGWLFTSKGLSPDRRANLVADLWHSFSAPAALCVDFSRFDAHVSEEALKIEHAFYMSVYKSGLLNFLLSQQLVNRGIGRFGTKYKRRGGRMSGDVNTALGNTVLSLTVLSFLCRGESVKIVCEGDDAVILGDYPTIKRLSKVSAEPLGFKLKVQVAMCLEDISYCSTFMLNDGLRWRSARDWPRPFLGDIYSPKTLTLHAIPQKARTMAVCFAVMYSGLPIYSVWAEYLLSHSDPDQGLDEWYDRNFWVKTVLGGAEDKGEVTDVARQSFFCSTAIPPSEQLRMEEEMRGAFGPYPAFVLWRERGALRRSTAALRL